MLASIAVGILMLSIEGCQSCLVTSRNTTPPFFNLNDPQSLPNGTQAIVTSYQFRCCGTVTEWLTYVHVLTSRHRNERAYDINFQIWRPSATEDRYDIVGFNYAPSIEIEGNDVAHVIPPNSERVSFMSGDVFGYFATTRIRNQNGNSLQLDGQLINDDLWFAPDGIDAAIESSSVFLGESNSYSFMNIGPVISVRVTTHPCPSTPVITSASSPVMSASSPVTTSASSPVILSTTTYASSLTTSPSLLVISSIPNIIHSSILSTPTDTFTSPGVQSISTMKFSSVFIPTMTETTMATENIITEALSENSGTPFSNFAIIIIAILGALVVTLACIIAAVIAIAKLRTRKKDIPSSIDDKNINNDTLNFNMRQNEVYSLGRIEQDPHYAEIYDHSDLNSSVYAEINSDVDTEHCAKTSTDHSTDTSRIYYTDLDADLNNGMDTNYDNDMSTDSNIKMSTDCKRKKDAQVDRESSLQPTHNPEDNQKSTYTEKDEMNIYYT